MYKLSKASKSTKLSAIAQFNQDIGLSFADRQALVHLLESVFQEKVEFGQSARFENISFAVCGLVDSDRLFVLEFNSEILSFSSRLMDEHKYSEYLKVKNECGESLVHWFRDFNEYPGSINVEYRKREAVKEAAFQSEMRQMRKMFKKK